MEHRGGVGGGAAVAEKALLVRIRTAIVALPSAPRRPVALQPLGHHIALAEIGVAVLDAEQADHAVAGQIGVPALLGRVLRIGDGAVPVAVDLLRQLPLDHQVEDVGLHPRRGVEAGKVHGLGEGLGHRGLLCRRLVHRRGLGLVVAHKGRNGKERTDEDRFDRRHGQRGPEAGEGSREPRPRGHRRHPQSRRGQDRRRDRHRLRSA